MDNFTPIYNLSHADKKPPFVSNLKIKNLIIILGLLFLILFISISSYLLNQRQKTASQAQTSSDWCWVCNISSDLSPKCPVVGKENICESTSICGNAPDCTGNPPSCPAPVGCNPPAQWWKKVSNPANEARDCNYYVEYPQHIPNCPAGETSYCLNFRYLQDPVTCEVWRCCQPIITPTTTIRPTITPTPTRVFTPTPTNTPSPTPTRVFTPTPTNTPSPTPTRVFTPTPTIPLACPASPNLSVKIYCPTCVCGEECTLNATGDAFCTNRYGIDFYCQPFAKSNLNGRCTKWGAEEFCITPIPTSL